MSSKSRKWDRRLKMEFQTDPKSDPQKISEPALSVLLDLTSKVRISAEGHLRLEGRFGVLILRSAQPGWSIQYIDDDEIVYEPVVETDDKRMTGFLRLLHKYRVISEDIDWQARA